MKKFTPYILAVLLTGAVIGLLLTGGKKKENRELDETFSFRKNDKLPYGLYTAYQTLPSLFPGAGIFTEKAEPGYWDELSAYDDNQLLLIVCGQFRPDETEMEKLVDFAAQGNDVFISAFYLSSSADEIFQCSSSSVDLIYFNAEDLDKPWRFRLNDPPFTQRKSYGYPGRTFESSFTGLDTSITDVLGTDDTGAPNFIRLRAGKGQVFVHLEPLAFSNYFLLHRNNMEFYEKAMSLVRPGIRKVAWDEYYQRKRAFGRPPEKRKNWMTVLMNMKNDAGQKPFRAALWLLIGLLLLYVLMEMRRKQRPIPVHTPPRNDSMDFVKTIGRLYFDKGDHRNLCRKMAAYFLEHVRSRYKLGTGDLGDAFVKNLHYKSGVDMEGISRIVAFIRYLEKAETVSPKELTDFHRQLESFYKKA